MISVLLHTASRDDFLAGQGIPSYFAALVDNLRQQTARDFELVYVDAHYETNRAHHATVAVPFPVKHVPIHPAHRYWYDRGNYFISAAKNTGILHADGELLISFDDAELFPRTLIANYRAHYRQGRFLLALHKRLRSLSPRVEYVSDHRWQQIKQTQTVGSNWAFAGTSFRLRDALEVNGFNERMDGYKALEDCEFAKRLSKLPGGRQFVMNRSAYLWILDHRSYTQVATFRAVENHGLLRCATDLPGWRANERPPSPQQLRLIVEETKRYRHFDPTAAKYRQQFAIWNATPAFDLAQQWQELRRG